MYYQEDDRAQRLFDVFEVLDGQLNVSYVNSTEHIVAWHKHKQLDKVYLFYLLSFFNLLNS